VNDADPIDKDEEVQDKAREPPNLPLRLISGHLEVESQCWLAVVRAVLSEFGLYILREPGVPVFVLIMGVSAMIQTYYCDYIWDHLSE
jgi:hypothetical protein